MFEVVDRAVEFIDNDKEQERGVLVVTGVNDKMIKTACFKLISMPLITDYCRVWCRGRHQC